MKKKIFLTMLIVSIFACLFAVAVSAADIPEWTEITEVSGMPDKSVFGTDGTSGATSRVLMSDGITYPAYYICKNSATLGFSFSDLNSKASKSYEAKDVIRIEIPKGTTTVSDAMKVANGFTSLLTIDIPYGVTKINQYGIKAVNENSGSPVVKVTLPSTLTSIGSQAFYGCNSLEELIIPEGVTEIPKEMAFNATSLKKLVLPSTIEKIGERAFRSSNLSNGVVIPEGCTEIVKNAFRGCSATYVELPSTLETVGEYAFAENEALTTLCSKAPMIGDYMFKNCFNLEFVTLENTKVIKIQAFNMSDPNISKISKLVLPEGLTTIGEYAFVRLSITELVTPSTLSTVDKYAFAYCKSLKKIVVLGPTIGTCMFADSANTIEELVLTNRLTSMGSGAFSNVRTDSFITYYTGNEDEAASFKSSFQEITTRFKEASYCSYEDYTSGNYTAKKYMFVYDCNLCDVAFDSIHTNPGDDGDCTTALICSMCKEYTIREAMAAHISSERITYVSFMENGEHYIGCTNEGCEYGEKKILAPLFVSLGYSVSEDGGVTTGFRVNYDAIIEYENATGEKLNYGLFVAVYDRIGNGDIIDLETGKTNKNAIALEVSNREFSILNIKINGFETPEQKSASFSFGMFVVATKDETKKLVYLQHDAPVDGSKYSYITYNSLIG